MIERLGLRHELRALGVTGQAREGTQRWGPDPQTGREWEVITPDTRVQIADTLAVPYRWICYLDITYTDPGYQYQERKQAGTGFLVGPRHVLTAAHNLLSEDGRCKAVRVAVSPARNGSKTPLGTADAAKWDIHPYWRRKNTFDRDYDYALITLDDDIGLRKYEQIDNRPLGWWGDKKWGAGTRLERLDPAQLDGQVVNIAGYPGDRPAGTLWRGDGTLSGPPGRGRTGKILSQDRLMLHTVDTHKGQSGAPVWMFDKASGRRTLVGIHVAPAPVFAIDASGNQRRTHNYALRITREVIRQLKAWM